MVKSTSITLSKDVDTRFRKCISMASCQKRGNRKEFADEAITEWCDKIEARGEPKK